MAKIIVTGGCGFIGSHLAAALCEHHDVFVIDNLLTGSRAHLKSFIAQKKIKLIIGDIQDQPLLNKTFENADMVFHLAARISVPESSEHPADYYQTNVLGTLAVLEACRHSGVKQITFASSSAVYGDLLENPKRESMLSAANSVYAQTKCDGEFLCQLFAKKYGIQATILRYFNVYGPRQRPESAYAAVIPIFIHHALQQKDLVIYGDGKQTRDFIYVQDIVKANLLTMRSPGGIYNVASGTAISVKDLAKKIIALTHSSSKIVYQPERAGDIKHSLADITKIKKSLKFTPDFDLTQGLQHIMEGTGMIEL